ncbi:YihY/virulence factor BrkB family protein [Haloarculaceae archaeon H-GB2-1]|nr:YihY/virulence factor BrkB family protein [Haloarculaceae archaeon H-GB1-1]MEA5388432.1 YihY/virulence factor BrkB family protein [Haloarculaceae archaeon H-GB11]MEA5406467.1 YihY/virulence factor BrkB family protein [Haloarculaceae archaeon H-GB2-1]
MSSLSDALEVGKAVRTEFSEKNVPFMAAGIAYNAFVSLAPLLILLLLFVSVVGADLEQRMITVAEESLPGPIADVVAQVFTGDAAAGVSAVSLLVLVWGSFKIFRGLDTAFSELYESERENSFVDQLEDGAVVGVVLALAVVATVAVSTVYARFTEAVPYLGFLTPLVLVGGLVLAFFPIYYRFPDADLTWREALPGAVFAAVGWAALQSLFQVYLSFKGGGSESFFGGVIVVVTWLYFSGLVLLLGAVVNAVLGGHSTGAPGGVGRGAALRKTDATQSTMDRDELASYLRDLRRRVTNHYEELDWATDPTVQNVRPDDDAVVRERDGTVRTYRPMSDPDPEFEVFERSRRVDDEREQIVTIRWREPDSDADEDE